MELCQRPRVRERMGRKSQKPWAKSSMTFAARGVSNDLVKRKVWPSVLGNRKGTTASFKSKRRGG